MRIDHWNRVSMSIRSKINLFDEQNKGEDDDQVETGLEYSQPDNTTMRNKGPFKSGHIILGAAQRSCSFAEISAVHSDDPAFAHFKNKFIHFIHADYNSEFIDDDLHSILDSKASVCLQILKVLNVTTQYIIIYTVT
jgi:hypothetical protein